MVNFMEEDYELWKSISKLRTMSHTEKWQFYRSMIRNSELHRRLESK
jgi:hypothetical protein